MDTILLAEDALELADVIDRELTTEGYRVIRTADGVTALRLHESERPELVILDWMLPEMDGLEVLRRLRQDPACAAAVLMLTARSEETGRVVGLELAMETGRTIEVMHDGRNYPLGPIIDPPAIITALQAGR